MACLLVSVCLGLSAVPGCWLTLAGGPTPFWFSALFELLTLAASIVGVLAGLGRFRDGWALSIACVAGTVLVSGVFAYVQLRQNFKGDPSIASLLKPALAGRLGVSMLLAFLASLAVWSRNTGSIRLVVRGSLLLAPVIGVVVWTRLGHALPMSTPRSSPGAEGVRIALWCLAGLLAIGLISAGGHALIRAYELGRPGSTPDKPGA